ncbi:unnamed protein product [Soboliphyme baturini]|uniref:KASH domain-containing protein n=1 Tax=Soboliphyme baturini TaxID=241478 RepID=A0A183IE63_9BILA|nr:unnamed protein product [Soboliphyme baturini]
MEQSLNSRDEVPAKPPIDSTGVMRFSVDYELVGHLGSGSPYMNGVMKSLTNDEPFLDMAEEDSCSCAVSECAALTQECLSLTKRLARAESGMKSSEIENERLASYSAELQRSIDKLKEENQRLAANESSYRYQVECAKYELDTFRNKLCEANDELMSVRLYTAVTDEENPSPSSDTAIDTQAEDLMFQMRIVCLFSVIPLFVLLVACLMAFFPTLSNITGTWDGPAYPSP